MCAAAVTTYAAPSGGEIYFSLIKEFLGWGGGMGVEVLRSPVYYNYAARGRQFIADVIFWGGDLCNTML